MQLGAEATRVEGERWSILAESVRLYPYCMVSVKFIVYNNVWNAYIPMGSVWARRCVGFLSYLTENVATVNFLKKHVLPVSVWVAGPGLGSIKFIFGLKETGLVWVVCASWSLKLG